ncbi:lysine--tRNA ligase [Vallitalea pronyensis]|uniref:Lysine--tRNA ligase n=1 Tax=Vallitalea pronyensis TaxID=1348613 RepID=A0A8J8MJH5_9FIRM|nr:lysine--tRNA ligase [Vallitalea pronyensis]QUI22952.1 lysine--tRNA ligase [Vallitalea pronyensis]
MHWAERIARELIEKYPERETYVCASGISPSGAVHIGNFREIVTTYFVVKALEGLGKRTRFIFSWDDYDRFRKVPKGIDGSYEQYIGMPYSEIPDPYGCHGSYAEHFEKAFEASLGEFGIDAQMIYQSRAYKSGRYNRYIKHALDCRQQIYDVIMGFKTQEPSEEERQAYYPVTVYCEQCGKDLTEVKDYDGSRLSYGCACGYEGVVDVLEARCMKLVWKVDWPMRWMVEDVVFEPGGRDHSDVGGSYMVSKEVVKHIFNHPGPEYAAYEFIGIKGSQGKMSSSVGNIMTPEDLLKVYTPELILYMFAKYKPSAAFNIGLDGDVVRHYTEYERYRERYNKGLLTDEDLCYAMTLSEVADTWRCLPSYSQVAGVFPLVNFDRCVLQDVLEKVGLIYDKEAIESISHRVEHWITTWCPEKMIRLNEEQDKAYYGTLSILEKKWLKDFCQLIGENGDEDMDVLMGDIYAICHDEDKKIMRTQQKRLFTMIYGLTINATSGPRLPLLMKAIGSKRLLYLLTFEEM